MEITKIAPNCRSFKGKFGKNQKILKKSCKSVKNQVKYDIFAEIGIKRCF